MQIFKPFISGNFLKYLLIIILSILLYACNSNYIQTSTDSALDEDISNQSEISEIQINIDELLIEKEIIKPLEMLNIEKIAILLPMTGKYSKIGKAIYEGIEIELNNINKNPQLTIHDTGDQNINLKKVYSEALKQNFDYVIGPLQKDLINKILKYSSEKLPILTLNYSNNLKKINQGVHQFGLLPEDESICIAEKAIIDGNSNAVIFYPDNNWGKRIAESFSLRFKELGGKIIESSIYAENVEKNNISIRNLLKIEDSIDRKKYLENILKIKLQYKPFISDDLDMIFSVGTSKDMRVIKPQFNFNYAEDIPFYSTSHIYNGVYNKEKNQDLNNIKFCDIPWLYNDKNSMIKTRLKENLDKKDLFRFVAIGMDSIKIIYNINQLKNHKNKFLLGDTGYLQLDEFNKVRRDLIIVKFKNGKAKKILF
tara:strand:- start:3349 stop:4626 length:1278 start_codon:yes stop_codon:yes gene_type:complete